MRLNLLCIGRLTLPFLRAGCDEFAERLKRYLPLTITEIKEHKTGRKQDLPKIIATEGENLEQRIPQGSFVIALDQGGKNMRSEQLAEFMNDHMVRSIPEWTLLIGGPYGLSAEFAQAGRPGPVTFTNDPDTSDGATAAP